jgi:predicted DNA-binding transcriptional regulator YafY
MAQWQLLVELHRTLSDNCHSYISKSELCSKIECKEVTFDRLIKILKEQFGAPLINSRRYGGYKYDIKDGETFELPGMWFKTGELEAMICLEGMFASLQKGYLNDLFLSFRTRLKKLLAAQNIEIKEWQKRFKIVPIAFRKTDSEIFRVITEAVLHRQKLKISYQKPADKDPTIRIISPQTVLRYRDNWYVDAWCHEKVALRTFTLNRIIKSELLDEVAIDVNEEELDAFFSHSYGIFTGPATHTAEILFTGIAAQQITTEVWHPKQTGELRTDGSYLLKIPYSNSRELIMDILRWGGEAEVINPAELREEIMNVIIKTAAKYRDES